jgi:hypothetical protein
MMQSPNECPKPHRQPRKKPCKREPHDNCAIALMWSRPGIIPVRISQDMSAVRTCTDTGQNQSEHEPIVPVSTCKKPIMTPNPIRPEYPMRCRSPSFRACSSPILNRLLPRLPSIRPTRLGFNFSLVLPFLLLPAVRIPLQYQQTSKFPNARSARFAKSTRILECNGQSSSTRRMLQTRCGRLR